MDIEEAKRLMAANGYAVSEIKQPMTAAGGADLGTGVQPTANAAGTGAEPISAGMPTANAAGTVAGDESGNGYYEILMARLDKMGDVESFNNGQSKKQTLTFAYKNRRGGECFLCCEAWNDQLNHDLQLGAYYDISLRLGCRTSMKDGRDFPTVSLAYAHRVRTVQMV